MCRHLGFKLIFKQESVRAEPPQMGDACSERSQSLPYGIYAPLH
jgi:hypothetical protein